MPLTGSDSRSGTLRRIIQIALGILSWIGFALLWMWQLQVYIPSTWLYSVCLIALIFIAWTAITILWVRWNQNIYSRRHRRTKPARIEVALDEDSLGRPIAAPGGIRAAEGQVFISVDESGVKRYDRRRRRLPSLPRLPAVPDWAPVAAVPAMRERVAATVSGNGTGRVAAPANGSGNGNGNGPAPGDTPGADPPGDTPGDTNGYPAVAATNGHARDIPGYPPSGANGNPRVDINGYPETAVDINGYPETVPVANGDGVQGDGVRSNGGGNGEPHLTSDARRAHLRRRAEQAGR